MKRRRDKKREGEKRKKAGRLNHYWTLNMNCTVNTGRDPADLSGDGHKQLDARAQVGMQGQSQPLLTQRARSEDSDDRKQLRSAAVQPEPPAHGDNCLRGLLLQTQGSFQSGRA